MEGRRNPFVAPEGIPLIVIAGIGAWASFRYLDLVWFGLSVFVFILFALIFRDPRRSIPPAPLGVVSPVDGTVVDIETVEKGVLHGRGHRILIRVNSLGAYTARCPVEGKVMNLEAEAGDRAVDYRTNALWVQTDEGDDVVLQFRGYRMGLPPRSFVRFGERLGQGARCAYLRLARFAEVHLPAESKLLVEPGGTVTAGCDLIAKLPHP
ncbi:MAG: hypothetical protein QNJ00_11290 [Woeseiaceae bacterium]|nr:hypothetical protein [Woeseiaceae bacterium]